MSEEIENKNSERNWKLHFSKKTTQQRKQRPCITLGTFPKNLETWIGILQNGGLLPKFVSGKCRKTGTLIQDALLCEKKDTKRASKLDGGYQLYSKKLHKYRSVRPSLVSQSKLKLILIMQVVTSCEMLGSSVSHFLV